MKDEIVQAVREYLGYGWTVTLSPPADAPRREGGFKFLVERAPDGSIPHFEERFAQVIEAVEDGWPVVLEPQTSELRERDGVRFVVQRAPDGTITDARRDESAT